MNTINKLTEYFSQFPGIGPRQARRFVHFLLSRNHRFIDELTGLLLTLKKEASTCESCYRYFTLGASPTTLCNICNDTNRNTNTIMVVAKDVDFENIERSGVYDGMYFILGGVVLLFEKKTQQNIRTKELVEHVEKQAIDGNVEEIIFAFSVNPDGENTTRFVTELLSPIAKKHNIKLSTLGRGLSTGTELEYPDSETIKNALQNRQY